jgi:hypothetical protein
MIDNRLLRKLLALSAALLGVAAGACALLGHVKFGLGLVLGLVLGAVPAASWAWIASRGMASRRNRILAAVTVVGKLALYSGLLYLLVAREWASPVATMVGITAVVAVLTIGSLAWGGPGAAPVAKGAA